MRILLDECCPAPLRSLLPDHDVYTVEEASLKGVHNGALIARAEAEFDLLVTADKNLRYQQNLVRTRLAIIELPFNSWPRLRLFGPMIGACLERIKPGEYVALGET